MLRRLLLFTLERLLCTPARFGPEAPQNFGAFRAPTQVKSLWFWSEGRGPSDAGSSPSMDPEAMEFGVEEMSKLEMLLLALEYRCSAPPSAATRHPVARTTTRIRPRPSRLARPYPPPASAPWGLPVPWLQGLLAVAAMDVDHDQPPEARRSQEQPEPEFEFVMATMPSIDHIRYGVPSSFTGGIVPPTRPHTPVRRETASTSARTRPHVVKFRSAYWVWIVLMDPPPPCDFNTTSG